MSVSSAAHQLVMALVGGAAMLVMAGIMKKPQIIRALSVPFAVLSLAILVALLFLGKESGGAKNWISVGGFLFQPSEFVKVALIVVLASAMTDSLTVKKLLPSILFTLAVTALLVVQRDLGAAMLTAGVFLILFYAATGNVAATLFGIAAGGAGAFASYLVFDHVKARVSVWLDPWATYSTSGYQIAQGLMAIASGGLWGEGLGLGSPSLIPAYRTDYVFAVICEEFGILFGVGVIAIYALIVVRGVMIALSSEHRFSSLCAFGSASLIAVQTFIIIGGVIKLIPLTGITMPFVSYGGSSMIAFMAMAGMLQGVAARNGTILEKRLEEVHEE
jgi:cell division protein FtsW (lipid II flippase)